jgi:hypothetical protein
MPVIRRAPSLHLPTGSLGQDEWRPSRQEEPTPSGPVLGCCSAGWVACSTSRSTGTKWKPLVEPARTRDRTLHHEQIVADARVNASPVTDAGGRDASIIGFVTRL